MSNNIPIHIQKAIKTLQKNEITEYHVYNKIAKRVKNPNNREILIRIASQEKAHHDIWQKYLGKPARPNRLMIFFYNLLSIIFGYTFALKIMERGENKAKKNYEMIGEYVDEANRIALEENEHEHELIAMLDEERLNYVGSMVLGLNDALVELSGTLAGLTFAIANTALISLSGLITGIAASMSMAASEYLSAKAENNPNALKSALYTGIAYIMTVALLVLPYLVIENHFVALGVMLGTVILIIFFFNFYISVAKGLPFRKRFLQMTIISLSVSAISFLIGMLIKSVLGVDV